ncbi:MAG TPA: hypothetical protein VGA95_10660 [Thermodesulfobacteriota bacterium]
MKKPSGRSRVPSVGLSAGLLVTIYIPTGKPSALLSTCLLVANYHTRGDPSTGSGQGLVGSQEILNDFPRWVAFTDIILMIQIKFRLARIFL